MQLWKWMVVGALLGGTGSALTAAEVAQELKLTAKPTAPLCQALAGAYRNVTGYTVARPFLLVRRANFASLTAQTLIVGGVGDFAPYQAQTWTDHGDGFWTLEALDSSKKGFRFWFDLTDRYNTDVCIQEVGAP